MGLGNNPEGGAFEPERLERWRKRTSYTDPRLSPVLQTTSPETQGALLAQLDKLQARSRKKKRVHEGSDIVPYDVMRRKPIDIKKAKATVAHMQQTGHHEVTNSIIRQRAKAVLAKAVLKHKEKDIIAQIKFQTAPTRPLDVRRSGPSIHYEGDDMFVFEDSKAESRLKHSKYNRVIKNIEKSRAGREADSSGYRLRWGKMIAKAAAQGRWSKKEAKDTYLGKEVKEALIEMLLETFKGRISARTNRYGQETTTQVRPREAGDPVSRRGGNATKEVHTPGRPTRKTAVTVDPRELKVGQLRRSKGPKPAMSFAELRAAAAKSPSLQRIIAKNKK
jgi:hypothetical protein